METAGSKKRSAEEPGEEVEWQMSSQPSTSSAKTKATGKKQKKSEKDNGCKPKEEIAQDTETPGHTSRKVPLNVPDSAKDARLKTSRKKMKTEPGEESQVTVPLEIVTVPEEQIPALIDPPMLYEEVSTTVVTTPASEAVLASWARIASNAKKFEAVSSSATSEVKGEMWCVVHGTSLPAKSGGWVRLQFHAGQAWVPDKKGKATALFLLPACTFPPPHLEDNMLCPKCVHRNKVLTKSLEG
ncbi:developmental pluripotency-associated protein 4-like isoform X2 [Grammomys surdaster]|uniref:developmental pluripotency-associated protein 4-like isoform X2 n=1 Tax=Grammomys surdaster TaxID=491861 RepID=UPI0010A07A79|nr:developmental pluripotency-associated protein 4-like isoform X2 [Grammomys surdaster]